MSDAWTDENYIILKTLWEAGQLSARQIASALGVSRSAVIGKAHRLKLVKGPGNPKPPTNRRPRGRPPGKTLGRKMARPETVSKLLDPPAMPSSANPVLISDLAPHHCRFPLWGAEVGGLYCGDPRIESLPYCAAHCIVCYTPAGLRPR